jgi:hypothetical protein
LLEQHAMTVAMFDIIEEQALAEKQSRAWRAGNASK